MKHSIKALAAGVALASASAHAAIDSNDILVNIQVDRGTGFGESMLVDTNLKFEDFIAGSVAPYTSDATLTGQIFDFIDGAADVRAYVFGGQKGTLVWETLSTSNVIDVQQEIQGGVESFEGFRTKANGPNSAFGRNDDGLADVEIGLTADDPAHFENPELWGNGIVGIGFGLDTPTSLYYSSYDPFGDGITANTELASWNLASDGTLSYVPLPAGVWLLGAALVGLLGAARRRAT